MGLFDSILPQAPEAAQTPTNLMALLKGLPATQGIAQQMPPTAPGMAAPPPPAAAPSPMGGTPMLPKIAPPPTADFNSLLPSPQRAELDAAAQGAAGAPVFNSPIATLASSALSAIRSGAPAFRAQSQANKEASYVAALQASQEKQYRDYVNGPDAAKQFGDKVSILKSLPTADGIKILQQADLWKGPTFSQNSSGDVINTSTGEVVHKGPGKPVAEGDAVPVVDANGRAVLDASGQPTYRIPNPKPVPTAVDRMSPGMIDAGIGLGFDNDAKKWSSAQRAAAYALDPDNPVNKLRQAAAGRPAAADVVGAEVNKKILADIATAAPAARQNVSTIGALQHGVDLLNSGQVNTGIASNVVQGWDRMTGSQRAAATQEYINTVAPTVLSGIKGQLGAGASMRLTQQEITAFGKAFGGDVTQLPEAIKATLQRRISSLQSDVTDHNARVVAFANDNPKSAGAILAQYTTRLPNVPQAPPTPPGAVQSTKNGRKGYVDPATGAFVYQEAPK